MKILAIDSTAKIASAALVEDGLVKAAYSIDAGLTQSEILLPMIDHILKSLHLSYNDIDAYAVTTGPGSFTGVRIGVATIKGLAFGRNLPCVGISTLEALAENGRGLDGVIVAAMDARRGEIYNAVFDASRGELSRRTADRAIPLSVLCEELRSEERPIYIIGDGYTVTYQALTEGGLSPAITPLPMRYANAASAALLAQQRMIRGEYQSERELTPSYLRLPQAERERLEKLKNNSAI